MIHRPRTHLLIPILALSMTLALAASLHAQDRYGQRTGDVSGTLQITFGSAPHWTEVSGTRVQVIRQGERPDYDMFHYGDSYYVYNNNRWYTSRQYSGAFTYIDMNSVPNELSMVPRDQWRQYPSEWQDRNRPGSDRMSGSLQVTFGRQPRWEQVGGTRVLVIRQEDRPDYDMFRYGDDYYVYNNNRWYTSRQWNGSFTYIDMNSVPNELSMVPRDQWRQYPSEWQDRGNRGPDRTSASLQITFGRQPRWTTIRGTRVMMIRQGQRPDYDMFRYGNNYYVYSNNQWYMSRYSRGEFRAIDVRMVPRQLAMVPRNHWRNYPQDWANRNDDWRYDQGRHRR